MLPSLLAHDIQQGITQFLITAFEPADGFFHGVMRRFVANEPAWMKGPYLQVGLPFRHDSAGRDCFRGFQTECPAYTHQREAWARLASDRMAAQTLVATGTGSGKTECFSYPLLDHCARARQAGAGGIKALVIYPMNARATDQARRFARFIASTPAFHGLRVGLFVGGNADAPGSGTWMTPESVITDRDTMRRHPPDILLTNYHAGGMAPPSLPRAEPQAYSRNAITQLLMLLSKPAADTEDPAMDQSRKNAIWATFLMVAPPGSPEAVQAEARLSDVWSQLPGWAQEVSEPHAIACSQDGAEPTLYCRWPRAFVHGTAADLQPPGVLVLNDVEPADEATRHTHWRCWLHLYNTFQTLTDVLQATTEGLLHHDYETIMPALTKAVGPQPTDATSQAWAVPAPARLSWPCTGRNGWQNMPRQRARWCW